MGTDETKDRPGEAADNAEPAATDTVAEPDTADTAPPHTAPDTVPDTDEPPVDEAGTDSDIAVANTDVADADVAVDDTEQPNPWSQDGATTWQPDTSVATLPGEETERAVLEADDYWADEYSDREMFTAIVSAPALALAAFGFALAGLLGGMIPEALPYLIQADANTGPAHHVRITGLVTLGFAIVSASLGFAALLRSIGSNLRWPRYLGGAAVLLALLMALQSVLLLVLAALAPQDGPS